MNVLDWSFNKTKYYFRGNKNWFKLLRPEWSYFCSLVIIVKLWLFLSNIVLTLWRPTLGDIPLHYVNMTVSKPCEHCRKGKSMLFSWFFYYLILTYLQNSFHSVIVKLGYRSVQVGTGRVKVGSRSAPCELWKFQGLSPISKRPGPGAWSYNCNVSTTTNHQTFLSRITLKSLHVWTE